MSEHTVHLWGFYEDDGSERPTAGASVTTETPYEAFTRLRRHVHHFGGRLDNLKTTRTLDGWFVGIEFCTPARGTAARMWHRVVRAADPWPDFAETEESA